MYPKIKKYLTVKVKIMPLTFHLSSENIGTWFMQRRRYLYSSGGHNLFQSGFYYLFDSAPADTEISGLIFLLRITDKKKNESNQGNDYVHLIPYALMQHLGDCDENLPVGL